MEKMVEALANDDKEIAIYRDFQDLVSKVEEFDCAIIDTACYKDLHKNWRTLKKYSNVPVKAFIKEKDCSYGCPESMSFDDDHFPNCIAFLKEQYKE
jgi:hypothetical protein